MFSGQSTIKLEINDKRIFFLKKQMGRGSHIHKHTANEEHSKDVNYWETF